MSLPIFDAVTVANLGGGASPNTFSHMVGAGANRVLYVVTVFWSDNGTNVSAVTYNGVGMSLVADGGPSSGNDRVKIWRLKAPTSGANTVSVSFTVNVSGRVYAVSFAAVDQTTPEGTAATNTGAASAAPTVTVTATAATDFVLDGLSFDATTVTASMVADAGRTSRGNAVFGGEGGACSEDQSVAASEVMDWTLTGNSTWCMAGIAVHGIMDAAAVLTKPDYSNFPKQKLRYVNR